MDILATISELEQEISKLTARKTECEEAVAKYESLLGPLKTELQDIEDTLFGLSGAKDNLLLLTDTPRCEQKVEIPKDPDEYIPPKPKDPPKFTKDGLLVGSLPTETKSHSRKAKAIVKKSPDGKTLKEYKSVNQASLDTGIGRHTMAYEVLNMPREKQVRKYGCYFSYKVVM